ncbi:uncharacterized protein LOC113358797 [Papaver somniferum]|uniref:uncharacterized protein LOC113358797 n=1 Tax=Papaver somniferum TaxID=3469 RepID=UPI000E6F64D4|nr:uncharacterized protein LOC113358797 [Papaver somniferum]
METQVRDMKTIPVWVMIYNVPLHLWNKLGLSVITSYLGNPLMMDECTKKKTRLTCARLCVEIDVECSFPSSIPLWIDGVHIMDLHVEYQWKPAKCLKCSSFGHKLNSCSSQVGKKKTLWTNKKDQQHHPKPVTVASEKVASIVEGGETNAINDLNGLHCSVLNANDHLDGSIIEGNVTNGVGIEVTKENHTFEKGLENTDALEMASLLPVSEPELVEKGSEPELVDQLIVDSVLKASSTTVDPCVERCVIGERVFE